MSRGPTARSSSLPSPRRRRACSARNIMPQNPLFPPAKTAGVINTDGGSDLRAGEELHHLGQRQARPARHADRRRQEAGPLLQPRPAPRGRPLLPLRPFLLRQGRRPGHQLRRRQRSGERRHRARRGAGQGIYRQALPPAERRMASDAGTSRAWPRTRTCSTMLGRDLANSREWPDWWRRQRVPRRFATIARPSGPARPHPLLLPPSAPRKGERG